MPDTNPPTLKQLQWLRGWFKHFSTPGPKVVLRSDGVETPQPFPDDSRQKCITKLAEIDALIAAHPDNTAGTK
jgi:hypothetical protein